jgi:hypothetical protein
MVPMGFGLPVHIWEKKLNLTKVIPQILVKNLLASSSHQSNGKKEKARRSTRGN